MNRLQTLTTQNHQLLMEVIADLAKRGYCIVMSTHSPEHPFSVGSKVLLMKAGGVAGFGLPKDHYVLKSSVCLRHRNGCCYDT